VIFRIDRRNATTCFIYGFKNSDRVYDTTMTLLETENLTEVHGFLSKAYLSFFDFAKLWDTLRAASASEWFEIEVFPEHARVYRLC